MVDAVTSNPAALPPALEVKNLVLVRPFLFQLGPLTFTLTPGSVTYIEGGNGFGKTTLLRAVAGLFLQRQGTITMPKNTLLRLIDHRRGLSPELTVREHLIFWQRLYQADPMAAKKAKHHFKLKPLLDRQIKYLSEGQRQRVSLTRLLIGESTLCLLDEPTSALDAEGLLLLQQLIQDKQEAGATIVMATHTRLIIPRFSTLSLPDGAITHYGGAV